MGFVLVSGTRRGWSFFNLLSYNAHKALIILHKFESAYCFYSIAKIMKRLTRLWKTRTIPLWYTSEKLTGIKQKSNVIQRSQTLPWKENCAKPYNLSVRDKRGEIYNQTNWLRIVQVRSTRPSHRFWRENIREKKSLPCYVKNVRGDAYFYIRRHHRGSRRISSAKTFGEFWPKRHRLGITTGMAYEIWGG